VPLKTPIEGIKCDPNCLHKKKLMTSSHIGNNQVNGMIFFFFIYCETFMKAIKLKV
jgi:hypothetical protein